MGVGLSGHSAACCAGVSRQVAATHRRAILAYAYYRDRLPRVHRLSGERGRPEITGTLDIAQFSDSHGGGSHRVDPAANAFPSLHLAWVTLAALAAWKASRMLGLLLGFSVRGGDRHATG